MKKQFTISEEFLMGLGAPTFVILCDKLLNLFGFLFYAFPIFLLATGVVYAVLKKWGVVLGILAFIGLSFIFRGIFPVFWAWIMADGAIIKALMR